MGILSTESNFRKDLMSNSRIMTKTFFISLILIILPQFSSASVILVGTRVIYPENEKYVNLNFRSSDRVPSIIDVWVSKSISSTENNNDAPFIVTPPIFRIDPNKGQVAKLIYNGQELPKDRESVFYLNFVQLPATDKDANKILVTFKSSVKVFYRPNGLKEKSENISSHIEFNVDELRNGFLNISNNSEYNLTINRISLKSNGKNLLTLVGDDINMISPFSNLEIKVKPVKNVSNIDVYIDMINDLGGISTFKIASK